MEGLIIRKAHRMDCKDIAELLKVQFEEFKAKGSDFPKGSKVSITEIDLVKDAFPYTESTPAFTCFVAYLKKKLIGFTIFYYTYSIYYGKGVFLEDIFVHPVYRGKKVGTKLFNKVAQVALNNCCKLDFALKHSKYNEFFLKNGAIITPRLPEYQFRYPYQISEESLKKLVLKKC